jgi:hypothetical protein
MPSIALQRCFTASLIGEKVQRQLNPTGGACEGLYRMAKKLKVYQISIGFFDLAVAAPSMNAAAEAWGVGPRHLQTRLGETD